jgi:hypothetical protein
MQYYDLKKNWRKIKRHFHIRLRESNGAGSRLVREIPRPDHDASV